MAISGETNVLSSRFGNGVIKEIGEELGRFVVTTMEVPWSLCRDELGGEPEDVLLVESMESEVVDRQVEEASDCDTVVGIGGGQAIDLAKYFAWKRGCRLVSIPTVVSVDAFVTPAAAIRFQHKVEYLGHASPDPLVIDFDLIRTAPSHLNIAGIGDLLSIHTATYDWELSERAGKSEFPFSASDIQEARTILELLEQQAEEISSLSDSGIRTLVESYMKVNTICLPAGHYRVEEGSEHFLFYELEERLQRPFIHGQIVGLGIYVMSRIQQNRSQWITDLMNRLGLRYHPLDMDIRKDDLMASLLNLKRFTEKRTLWHSIIQEANIDLALANSSIEGLRFKN